MSQEHQNYILSQTCLYAKQLYHQRLNNDQDARNFNYITIVDLYQAVKDLSKRIKIYVDVCDIGAIDLNQLNQNEVTEFDHHAFIQILDQMKPDSAMDNIHYKKWQNQVAKLKTIFHSIAPNKPIHNKWHKVSIISLYFESVWSFSRSREIVIEKAEWLWKILKDDVDYVESDKTFSIVLKGKTYSIPWFISSFDK